MLGKKLVIWGLGKEYNHYKYIIHSEEILSDKCGTRERYVIVGEYDTNNSKTTTITLQEIRKTIPDLVVTSKYLESEIKQIIIELDLCDTEVVSFEKIISDRLMVHNMAVGNGEAFDQYIRLVKERSNIEIENFVEIGANYGQDSAYCQLLLNISPNCVYCFEANPYIAREIEKRYDFNVYNVAVGDKNQNIELRMVPSSINNSGISTIMDYDYSREWERVKIDCIRMDSFLENNTMWGKKFEKIDFLKIDVEGVNYEVLKGFGDYLECVRAIQIEGDHVSEFNNHHLFDEIVFLLYSNGFELVDYVLHRGNTQSDSLWIKKSELK